MKKNKIYTIKRAVTVFFVIILLSTPIITSSNKIDNNSKTTLLGNNESQLNVIIFGTIRLFFAPALYWGIENTGDITAFNISGTFRVIGGLDNSINYMDTFNIEEILAKHTVGRWYTRPIDGFGPLTLTCRAVSSNAGNATKSVNGFLIGFRAFVFG
jgi:hypothetical protein